MYNADSPSSPHPPPLSPQLWPCPPGVRRSVAADLGRDRLEHLDDNPRAREKVVALTLLDDERAIGQLPLEPPDAWKDERGTLR